MLVACGSGGDSAEGSVEDYANYLRVRSTTLQSIEQASLALFTQYEIPAAVTAIINRGDIIYIIEHGVDDLEHKKPARADTIFRSDNLSQVFTAIIAQNLIQDGRLDPDATLVSYLTNQLSAEAAQRLAGLTIADLLHNRSGFSRLQTSSDGDVSDVDLDTSSDGTLWQFLEGVELVAAPAQQARDTSRDFAVLALVLEIVTRTSYRDLLYKFVTGPFGLFDTGFTLSRSSRLRLATAYEEEDRTQAVLVNSPSEKSSAPGLYSTVQDISRLMILQMKAYQRFENDQLVSPLLLTTEVSGSEAVQRGGFGFLSREVDHDDHSYHVHSLTGYGRGFASSYFFIPGLDVGAVTLASSGGDWITEQQNSMLCKLLTCEAAP